DRSPLTSRVSPRTAARIAVRAAPVPEREPPRSKDSKMSRPAILPRRFSLEVGRRPRRALCPAVRTLEGRQLLTGGAAASATMTQTATCPDLEANPNLSDQSLLYFSATMGTLTEVDIVTSGSFQTQFSAANLANSARTITGTTSADLSINLPTGSIPVDVPA